MTGRDKERKTRRCEKGELKGEVRERKEIKRKMKIYFTQ
jgi:hypothetical protein